MFNGAGSRAGRGRRLPKATALPATSLTGTIPAARMPAHTGDVTSTVGTVALAIAGNAVLNGALAQMAANTLKGNNTGATANAADLTGAQVQALLTAQPTVQTFTASGTWTKPPGCKRAKPRAVGGGGGGGGAVAAAANAAAAVGGGSGSYGEGVFDVTGTATVTVTIGAAGAAGASGASGGAGGATSFGALLTAPGGIGGIFMSSGTALSVTGSGSSAAAGTGGSINSGGNAGEGGIRLSGLIAMSGNGAPGPWGGGTSGRNSASGGEGVGASGTGPGAGGAGALSLSATGFAGGSGAVGMVIVEEFY